MVIASLKSKRHTVISPVFAYLRLSQADGEFLATDTAIRISNDYPDLVISGADIIKRPNNQTGLSVDSHPFRSNLKLISQPAAVDVSRFNLVTVLHRLKRFWRL